MSHVPEDKLTPRHVCKVVIRLSEVLSNGRIKEEMKLRGGIRVKEKFDVWLEWVQKKLIVYIMKFSKYRAK